MLSRINLRSCLFALFCISIFDGLCDASADNQTPRSDSSLNSPLRVAIVGAGVAGASAAFHLHELSRSAPISITIYESEPIVGGRVVSVSPPEAPRKFFEAGAPSFFTDDDCLIDGLESSGLRLPYSIPWALPKSLGLWNGQDIVAGPSCNLKSPSWPHLAHMVARYGVSAWRFDWAIASTSTKWKILGALRPFDDVGRALRDADLGKDVVFGSAKTYLRNLGISSRFLSEYVEPCTRARFSQNLADVSAFPALMAMRRAKEASIYGGNARLIERMINLSGADVHLNSTVVGIRDGETHRYQMSVASTDIVHTGFDIIVLAFPLHDGSIDLNIADFSGRSKQSSMTPQSYAESHVTHFSTSATLSPAFFHPSSNDSIPYDLLTTAQSSNILTIGRSHVCYKRYYCLADDECDQCDDDHNMYRVSSRRLLSDSDLATLIGKQWREGQSLADIDISWVHRRAWPQALPTLGASDEAGKFEVAPKLFHLGGVERVLSSMEMSCRMGRNIARLLTRSGVNEMDMPHSEL